MSPAKFIKLVKKLFPGSVVIDEPKEINITPSEAGRILSKSKKNKKDLKDKNQLDLFGN